MTNTRLFGRFGRNAGFILAGLMILGGPSLATVKLLMILSLLLVTSPTSTHVLAKAALAHGVKPRTTDREGNPSGS